MSIIKSIRPPSGLTVLLRETYRSKKFKNQASFLEESRVVSFSENITLIERGAEDDDSGNSGDDLTT
mgnify:CR=1 FL=1